MLILVLILGGFWYFHDIRGGERRLEEETAQKQVFARISPQDFISIVWSDGQESKDSRVVYQKDAIGWLALLPDGHKVRMDSAIFSGLSQNLADLSMVEKIMDAPSAAALPQFGLDKPKFKMVLNYRRDGKDEKSVLFLGGEAEDESGFYAYAGEKPETVIEVPGDFAKTLNMPFTELIEKNFLPVAPGKMVKLKYDSYEGSRPGWFELSLHRNRTAGDAEAAAEGGESVAEDSEPDISGSDRWFVSNQSGETSAADMTKTNDFIWSLRNLKVSRYMHPDEKNKLGRIRGRYSVALGKGRGSMTLEFGAAAPGKKDTLYARRTDPDEYMEVDYSALPGGLKSLLGLRADDFTDKHIAVFSMEDVQKFSVRVESKRAEGAFETEARRIKGGWEVIKPEKAISNEGKINSAVEDLLYSLADLQWKEKLEVSSPERLPVIASTKLTLEGENAESLDFVIRELSAADNKYVVIDKSGKGLLLADDPRSHWIKAYEQLSLEGPKGRKDKPEK